MPCRESGIGFAETVDGYYHSFLLTAIPKPSTVALLALGGAAWLLRRRVARYSCKPVLSKPGEYSLETP